MKDGKHTILRVLILNVRIGKHANDPVCTAMDRHFLPGDIDNLVDMFMRAYNLCLIIDQSWQINNFHLWLYVPIFLP